MPASNNTPRALSLSTENVFVAHCFLKNDDSRILWYPTASTHQIQNLEACIVLRLQKKKGSPVQEYTDWSIVYVKADVIIYFPLVFHQPKLHIHMQVSHSYGKDLKATFTH